VSGKIIVLRHPFRSDREILPGVSGTVSDALTIAGVDFALVIVNDEAVEDFDAPVTPEDTVIIRAVPQGGVGDAIRGIGDDIADGVGDFVDGVGDTISDIGDGIYDFFHTIYVGFDLMLQGLGWLIQRSFRNWLGVKELSFDPGSDQRLPSIRGSRNQGVPWGPIPVLLGRHYMAPPLATRPYAELRGDEQYFRQLFVLGYGPMSLSDIRIGETPIGDFEGVTQQVRASGAQLSQPVTIVPNVVDEEVVNVKLDNAFISRTTSLETTEISVEINFPRGAVRFDDQGNRQNTSVEVVVQCKPFSGGSWATVHTFTVTSRDSKQIRKAVTFTPPAGDAAGQYDVQVRRVTALNEDNNKINDDVYWASMRSFVNQDPVNNNLHGTVARMGLQIKATDQLNGAVSQLNMVGSAIVPDYAGTGSGSSVWVAGETQNPASLYLYVLRGNAAARPVDDDEIDWAAFESWHAFCETNDFKYSDYVQSKTSVSELLTFIAGAGRAQPARRDGKYSVIVDRPRSTAVQMFTPRNSHGFSAMKVFDDEPHAIKIQFVNEDNGYQQDECFVYADGYGIGNATQFETITLRGVTRYDQAWKEGRYRMAVRKLRPEVYTLNVDIEHFVATRGDLVKVQNDVILVGITSGRVKGLVTSGSDITGIEIDEAVSPPVGETCAVRLRLADGSFVVQDVTNTPGFETTTLTFSAPVVGVVEGDLFAFGVSGKETGDYLIMAVSPGDDMTAQLTLVDYSPEVYDADTGTIPAFDSNVTPPADIKIEPPGLSIVAVWSDDTAAIPSPDGSLTQTMVVAWSIPETLFDIEWVEVSWRISGGDEAWTRHEVSAGESSYGIPGVIPGQTYAIQLRAVTNDRIRGPYVQTTHVVTGADNSLIPGGLPTYDDLDNGWTSTNGTTTPAQLILSAKSYLRTVGLSWTGQTNLTNWQQYEVQVTDDPTAVADPTMVDWYSLNSDGTSWNGVLDEVTVVYGTVILHQAIPHEGTAADPTSRQLWYRVRQRTKVDDVSPWSEVAAAQTNPATSEDIAAESVTAEKIDALSVFGQDIEVGAQIRAKFSPAGNPIDENGDEIPIEEATAGFHLSQNGKLQAINADLFGKLRTGADAAQDAKVAIADGSGITAGPTFDGSGINDLVILGEGTVAGEWEVEISTFVPPTQLPYWRVKPSLKGSVPFTYLAGNNPVSYYGAYDYSSLSFVVLSGNKSGMPQNVYVYLTASSYEPISGSPPYPGYTITVDEWGTSPLSSWTTPGIDKFRWRKDGGAWSSEIEIPSSLSYLIPGSEITIGFSTRFGHTVGDSWTFTQAATRALSIRDVNGDEFFSASAGSVYYQGRLLISSGQFYPTLMGTEGLDATQITSSKCYYQRVGDFVQIYGAIRTDGTDGIVAGDSLQVDMNLPWEPRNVHSSSLFKMAGSFFLYGKVGGSANAEGHIVGNDSMFWFEIMAVTNTVTCSGPWFFQGTYRIA
jgi:hypothetical protein